MPAPQWLRDLDTSVRRYVTPTVRWLIYINVLIWLGTTLLFALFIPSAELHWKYITLFGATPLAILQGFVWQFVTYMFLHADAGHLLFNMIILWFFGSVMEQRWGSRRFLRFYLLCGISAAVVYETVVLCQVFLFHTGAARLGPMVGASGALYGVLFAFAFYYPEQPILFAFVIPIPSRVLVAILIALSLVGSLQPGIDNTAHLCHLAGVGFAWIYLMWPRWFGRGPRRGRFRPVQFR